MAGKSRFSLRALSQDPNIPDMPCATTALPLSSFSARVTRLQKTMSAPKRIEKREGPCTSLSVQIISQLGKLKQVTRPHVTS